MDERAALKKQLQALGRCRRGCVDLLRFRAAQTDANAMQSTHYRAPTAPPAQLTFAYTTAYAAHAGNILCLPLPVLALVMEHANHRYFHVYRLACKQFFEAVRRAWATLGTRKYGAHGYTFKTCLLDRYLFYRANIPKSVCRDRFRTRHATVEAVLSVHTYADHLSAFWVYRAHQEHAYGVEHAFLRKRLLGYLQRVLDSLRALGVHFLVLSEAFLTLDQHCRARYILDVSRMRALLPSAENIDGDFSPPHALAERIYNEAIRHTLYGPHTLAVFNALPWHVTATKALPCILDVLCRDECARELWGRTMTHAERVACAASLPALKVDERTLVWTRDMRLKGGGGGKENAGFHDTHVCINLSGVRNFVEQ